jgi:hypothetical protein
MTDYRIYKELVPGKTIEEKEEALLNCGLKLRLRDFGVVAEKTVEEFLFNFFKHYNQISWTVNAETEDLTTRPDAHRSLIDIFLICKHYFPDCKLKQVKKWLLDQPDLYSHICITIDRRVYNTLPENYNPNVQEYTIADSEDLDEFSYSLTQLDVNEFGEIKSIVRIDSGEDDDDEDDF